MEVNYCFSMGKKRFSTHEIIIDEEKDTMGYLWIWQGERRIFTLKMKFLVLLDSVEIL